MIQRSNRFRALCCTFAWVAVLSASSDLIGAEVRLQTELLWRYDQATTGCEIACYEPHSERLYVTIADGISILAVDTGKQLDTIEAPPGFHATSISQSKGYLAIAWAAKERTERGKLAVFSVEPDESHGPKLLKTFEAGFLPDMLTFSPDGRWLLASNEGEPSDDYTQDPEGSITAIDLASGVDAAVEHQLNFQSYNSKRSTLRSAGIRIFGPSHTHSDRQATVAEDLEPEYITISADSRRAWVSLQENNVVAELNLDGLKIVALHPLGLKYFGENAGSTVSQGRGFDASDIDGGSHIQHWPVCGLLQPDSVGALRADGVDYLLTVNEGDPRKYASYQECCAVGELQSQGVPLGELLLDDTLYDETQLGRPQNVLW